MKSTNLSGFTLLELLICIVIIAVLVLISSAMVLDAGEKAKDSAVKANAAAAASTVAYKLTIDPIPNDELIEYVVDELNDPDGEAETGDEIRSPFNKNADGFTGNETADAGQVTIIAESDIIVRIRGYGKKGSNGAQIITKVVSTLDLE